MVSIFKAIRDNDIQLLKYFIDLSVGDQQRQRSNIANIPKNDLQWIQKYLKNAGLKYFDLNKRSTKGRTPLHYAVTWNRVEIAKLLIDCPNVNVNLCDLENGWTALHRCLYLGNIEIAIMLMQRDDIDVGLKDYEGLTAFELYNSTVIDCYPTESSILIDNAETNIDDMDSKDHYYHHHTAFARRGGTDLYTWGFNTNYVLGHPDSENRLRPERVKLQLESHKLPFFMQRPHHLIQSVNMSKYHMAILTTECSHNLLLCGFGRGGRLGTGKELDTQFTPTPVQWPERFASVALGRDHTIAVTETGNVVTFGSNQYSQLGYETENQQKKDEAPMQLVPRKIQAQTLKKQPIIGAAASRIHSVVYTRNDIFTWGYNQGQLGYHQPDDEVNQISPRKVGMPTEILQVVANDNATTILTKSHEIILLCNYTQQKLFLPSSRFPTGIAVHRSEAIYPIKLLGSETDYLGAITNTGDIFIWTCRSKKPRNFVQTQQPTEHKKSTNNYSNRMLVTISAPKRIWNYDKSRLAAVDAAIGQNGEILICVQSGYVFKGHIESNSYKFSQVPQLQRCIHVCANSSGAFAAIRSEYALPAITTEVVSTLEKDIIKSLPHATISKDLAEEIKRKRTEMEIAIEAENIKCNNMNLTEQEMEKYLSECKSKIRERYTNLALASVEDGWTQITQLALNDETLDIVFNVDNREIYCHSFILKCRSGIFEQLLKMEDRSVVNDMKFTVRKQGSTDRIVIYIDSCNLAALLLLIDYVYTDQYEHPMKAFCQYPALCFESMDAYFTPTTNMIKAVQKDLITLSKIFSLPQLEASAQSSFSHKPLPTLTDHLRLLLETKKGANITLQLKNTAEKTKCHEVIVRQRCPFFKHLFQPGSVWSMNRKKKAKAVQENSDNNCVTVSLDHISPTIMEILLKYIYLDEDESVLFQNVVADKEETMLDILLSTLCEADALMLNRLKVITEKALVPFIKLRSARTIIEYADNYLADNLKQSCLKFIAVNLPVFLVSRMLDPLSRSLVINIENYIRECQINFMPLVSHLPPVLNHINDPDVQTEDTEISSSLFALSKSDKFINTFTEVLVTYYPEKASSVENKPAFMKKSITDGSQIIESLIKKDDSKVMSLKLSKGSRNGLDKPEERFEAHSVLDQQRSSTGWAPLTPASSIDNPSVSLREIMETEMRPSETMPKILKSTTVKKVSQKERKRLAHQQELESMLENSASSSKPVWGKLPTVDVKPIVKIIKEAANNSAEPSTSKIRAPSTGDNKGKKIYIPEEYIDDIENFRDVEGIDVEVPIFNPVESFGPSFSQTPMRCFNFDKNDRRGAPSPKFSLRNIQQQQKMEDSWLKGNKPKKNILRIQKEEEALRGIAQFYVQTLDVMTGEWFEVKQLSSK
ncbi:hypothetical protein BDF20DRAFT_915702 [Mycotypha africana]|uniref:uncharacterized protein n=1 Tax=Mycotypha africana TaxID=64632 RepID=UPI002300D523|nr:uncharacterized protein BDF20DRAFT_915702 [Mycotypha africana]KAI8971962.1 hypothetical protein BDF20DRAFT_915702 [Mycotypha africana]